MESLPQAWASSHTVLMILFGVTSWVTALHLTLARRGHVANAWVALWSASTAVFQLGRFVQIHTASPDSAVLAARVCLAMLPLMGGLGFMVRSLAGRRETPSTLLGFVGAAAVVAGLGLFTPFFMGDTPTPKLDSFGRSFYGVTAGPGMPWVGVGMLAGCAWMVHEARALERRDRIVLLVSLGVWLAIGLLAVGQLLIGHPFPMVAGLGPAFTAVGLSHLVVGHERRLTRAQAERGMQELAASEARLRGLVEHAPIGIMACDATGQVQTVNPGMWQMFATPEAVRQRPLGNMLEYERARREAGAPQLVHRALETGETQTGEVSFAASWTSAKRLRVTVAPLRAESGEVSGALLLAEDVTGHDELERRLRLAQKMEAVGQLAAGIAHEINTPMAYVRSNLRALHEDWSALREEVRKDAESETTTGLLAGAEALIDESLEGVERTISIARDMREFAHSAHAAHEPVDVNHELEMCVRLASTQHPSVAIAESYGELPLLRASAGQLRQVFLNLIVNALQAVAADGRVRVSSAVEGAFASVRVEDDGCGIAAEIQHRLFEPFFTTKPADQGTGLGLYISYQIVRAHGGEIRVDSSLGQGATFEVRLPLTRA